MEVVTCDEHTLDLMRKYIRLLQIPTDDLMVTTDRKVYAAWLGRRIPAAYGGAYCYLRKQKRHAILINLDRIDLEKPWALDVVVAEELIHMRDHLEGDHRRHSHHGYDRIATRVSELTGVLPDDIRAALIPVQQRPYRYVYRCPSCNRTVRRRKTGVWSCGKCSRGFDRMYVLQLVQRIGDYDQSEPVPAG